MLMIGLIIVNVNLFPKKIKIFIQIQLKKDEDFLENLSGKIWMNQKYKII